MPITPESIEQVLGAVKSAENHWTLTVGPDKFYIRRYECGTPPRIATAISYNNHKDFIQFDTMGELVRGVWALAVQHGRNLYRQEVRGFFKDLLGNLGED